MDSVSCVFESIPNHGQKEQTNSYNSRDLSK